MKIPDHFFRYFIVATILLASGIALVILQTAVAHPATGPLDAAALQARAEYHSETVLPVMATVFPRLLFLNAGVALLILMVPLFWVWAWWFRRDLLDPLITLMQATVCLLMAALGHNSFTKIYITYRLLPLPVVAAMYLPHGLPEMLAFICAGTSAFLLIESVRTYLQVNKDSPALHPGDICLFIFGRAWKAGLVVFLLMVLAAATESRVTPLLVESAFAAATQRS